MHRLSCHTCLKKRAFNTQQHEYNKIFYQRGQPICQHLICLFYCLFSAVSDSDQLLWPKLQKIDYFLYQAHPYLSSQLLILSCLTCLQHYALSSKEKPWAKLLGDCFLIIGRLQRLWRMRLSQYSDSVFQFPLDL